MTNKEYKTHHERLWNKHWSRALAIGVFAAGMVFYVLDKIREAL